MKKFQVVVVFQDESSINFNCDNTNEIQKTIENIFVYYDENFIKVIQILNIDNLKK